MSTIQIPSRTHADGLSLLTCPGTIALLFLGVYTQGPESLCQTCPPPSYRWMSGQAAAERWRIGVGTGRQLLLISQLMAVANDNPFSFTVSVGPT